MFVGAHKCGTIKYNKAIHVYPVNCGGKKGSYVRIEQPKNHLTIPEVQVFASTAGATGDLAAFYTKHVPKSLTYPLASIPQKYKFITLPGGPIIPGSVFVFKGKIMDNKSRWAFNLNHNDKLNVSNLVAKFMNSRISAINLTLKIFLLRRHCTSTRDRSKRGLSSIRPSGRENGKAGQRSFTFHGLVPSLRARNGPWLSLFIRNTTDS